MQILPNFFGYFVSLNPLTCNSQRSQVICTAAKRVSRSYDCVFVVEGLRDKMFDRFDRIYQKNYSRV